MDENTKIKIAVDIDFITFGFVFCFNSKLLRPRHCLGGRICYVVTGRVMASRVVESQTLPRFSKVLRWSYELYIWLMCCPKLDSLIVILIVCIYFHFWLLCLFHVWVSIADIVLYCLSFQVPAKESKALRGHCGLDRPLLIIPRFSCGSWVFTRDWVLLITWTIFKRRDSTYGGHNITNGSKFNEWLNITCGRKVTRQSSNIT